MAAHEPVNVWIADLDAAAPEHCAALLSDDERARAAELAGERARVRWIASRAILRAVVGDFAGLDPHALRFVLGPHGKPRLAPSPRPPLPRQRGSRCPPPPRSDSQSRDGALHSDGALYFNMSHSGSLAVYALAWDREVGIDVELADRRRPASGDALALATRLLGDDVARRLASLPQALRADAFLREWTAYEARVKCLGVGIGAARDAAAAARLSGLSVTEIDVGESAFAAVASDGEMADVQVGKWG